MNNMVAKIKMGGVRGGVETVLTHTDPPLELKYKPGDLLVHSPPLTFTATTGRGYRTGFSF